MSALYLITHNLWAVCAVIALSSASLANPIPSKDLTGAGSIESAFNSSKTLSPVSATLSQIFAALRAAAGKSPSYDAQKMAAVSDGGGRGGTPFLPGITNLLSSFRNSQTNVFANSDALVRFMESYADSVNSPDSNNLDYQPEEETPLPTVDYSSPNGLGEILFKLLNGLGSLLTRLLPNLLG